MLRNLIDRFDDSSKYSDEFLFTAFSTGAGAAIQQKALTRQSVSPFNFLSFCVTLQKGTLVECSPSVFGCPVLKSTCKIPDPVRNRFTQLMRVNTVDLYPIPIVQAQLSKTYQYDPLMKSKLLATIFNDHLYILNANVDALIPSTVVVEGVFPNVSQLVDLYNCKGEPCFNPQTTDFPIDPDLELIAYKEALALLGYNLSSKDNEDIQDR